jgi:hypothetical protein
MAEPQARSRKSRRQLKIDFSVEAYKKVAELKERAELATDADLIRNALRLYDWYLQQVKTDNHRIQLVKDGVIKEVEIFF